MPNNKMMAVAVTILETMMEVFPKEHLDVMFVGLLDHGDVVEMVMLDLINFRKACCRKADTRA